LDIIRDFSHLFFPGCQTKVLPSIDFDSKIEKRINAFTNQPQYLVSDLIAHLKNRNNRQELFSIIVTMVDIYPDPEWNFVYGQASIEEGIAVYSFARFDPLFPHSSQQLSTNTERILILKRAVSTYLHETMHLFGLAHCIYYLCLMNGANCETEMDRPLVYLCPICLRKMYEVQNYDVIQIYQNILELSKKIGFQEEENWYENRLKILNKHSSEKF
jgi:archaemetzincin